MDKKPLVSILIPAYNVEHYLPQCLDSILSQTYHDLQVIVIDDGSTDNTWDVCQRYAEKDGRVEVFHQENQGVAVTRNNLLERITSEVFLFVDADDWIEPDMVSFLVEKMNNEKTDIVVCASTDTFDEISAKNYTEQYWDKDTTIKEFLRHQKMNGSLWNKLIKTCLIQGERFRSEISYGEDALFCWHIIQKVKGVCVTNKPLYHHRMDNSDSLSHRSWRPDKNGTGTIVWRTITDETTTKWPQFLEIAKARYAIEDMWCLYYASLASYPYDKHIKERQLNVRRNLGIIRRSGLVSLNKVVASYALAYCYRLGRLLK